MGRNPPDNRGALERVIVRHNFRTVAVSEELKLGYLARRCGFENSNGESSAAAVRYVANCSESLRGVAPVPSDVIWVEEHLNTLSPITLVHNYGGRLVD